MHNLGTVFWFEVIRTLKKPSFWLMSLLVPVMAAIVIGIIYFSNQATNDAFERATSQKISLEITDSAGIIDPALMGGFGATLVSDKPGAIERVRTGVSDAYIFYPADIVSEEVEVYGRDVGVFDNGKYNEIAQLLLNQSIAQNVSPSEAAALQGAASYDSTTYREGEPYDPILEMIAPGIFLILFYFLIGFFGNQMLTSTTEEKENRVIEMMLTSVRAKTLIMGKILSLITLGLLQTAIILVPILIGYLLLRERLELPNINIADLPLDPAAIGTSALIFLVSFLLFTGILVTIGAAVPTAKEASGFFGVIAIAIFGPLYASPLFISSPESPVVQFLTFFPLTAPIPLMLRNAVGNLEAWEAGVAIAILIATTFIVLNIAVRVFRSGALEYSRKLSFREIIGPNK